MKNLVIIGAGGYGREVYCVARESLGYGEDFTIKGYLDDNINALQSFSNYPPIIGTVRDYEPQQGDLFICAIGNPAIKRYCVESLLKKGATFTTLIHKEAHISMNTIIGIGCIICRDAILSCDVSVGDYVTFQSYATIGHDAKIGSFCQFNSFSFMGGGSEVGNNTTMNVGAILHPYKKIGNNCIVGAGSVVIKNVKDGNTVYGNPAKILNI